MTRFWQIFSSYGDSRNNVCNSLLIPVQYDDPPARLSEPVSSSSVRAEGLGTPLSGARYFLPVADPLKSRTIIPGRILTLMRGGLVTSIEKAARAGVGRSGRTSPPYWTALLARRITIPTSWAYRQTS
jgi:hypothetical protein